MLAEIRVPADARDPAPAAARPLRVLTLTSLYPSTARPRHGVFVETRLRKLVDSGDAEAKVIAPVPWFPLDARWCGSYGAYARTPRRESRAGLDVSHPRYLMLPRVGMAFQPDAYARAAVGDARRLTAEGFDFDVIDAHYFYPDGVAAAAVARRLGRPYTVTARGSDINLIAGLDGPRRRILDAARGAARLIAVSAALKTRMVELGMDPERIEVLRNGVDCALFAPVPREEARRAFALPDAPVLACVGNLVPEKGVHLVLDALALLPGWCGLVVGEGPEAQRLLARARALGIAPRLRMLPSMPQSRLTAVYAAADALVLASSREGWPNVLLESMACGTPAIAAHVGGVAEIMTGPAAGTLLEERSAPSIASAARALLASPPSRAATRAHALRFGWGEVTRAQLAILRDAAGRAPC
jgi:glycosyltransferase involved in cell wall biosynthesis